MRVTSLGPNPPYLHLVSCSSKAQLIHICMHYQYSPISESLKGLYLAENSVFRSHNLLCLIQLKWQVPFVSKSREGPGSEFLCPSAVAARPEYHAGQWNIRDCPKPGLRGPLWHEHHATEMWRLCVIYLYHSGKKMFYVLATTIHCTYYNFLNFFHCCKFSETSIWYKYWTVTWNIVCIWW